jgi:hypothetical protein
MRRRCTCTGDPQRDPCARCARQIDLAESPEPDPHGWMALQDAYERHLDRMAP